MFFCPSFCLTFILFHYLVGGCTFVMFYHCCMSRFSCYKTFLSDLAMLKLTIIADSTTTCILDLTAIAELATIADLATISDLTDNSCIDCYS